MEELEVEVEELTAGELEGGVFDGLMGRDKDSEESSEPSLKYRILKLPADLTVWFHNKKKSSKSHPTHL